MVWATFSTKTMSGKQSSDAIITVLYLNVICEPKNTVLLTINLKGVHYS